MLPPPPTSTLFPYTTLFRSDLTSMPYAFLSAPLSTDFLPAAFARAAPEACAARLRGPLKYSRSEEHTSELQSQSNLVCRLLLEKKKRRENQLQNREHTKDRY